MLTNNRRKLHLIICTVLWLFGNGTAFANSQPEPVVVPPYDMKAYDQELTNLQRKLAHIKDINQRITAISEYFLNKPYLLGPNGEGTTGRYDQNPLYRTDAFDCVTYVNTVLALAETRTLAQFKKAIAFINYQNGQISYATRNHFTSIDWNAQNLHNGYLMDITNQIIDDTGEPIAEIADTMIDKPSWFAMKKLSDLKLLQKVSAAQAEQLLAKLRAEGQNQQQVKSVLLYLPLTKLFDKDGQPNQALFDQIPSGSIIEIVRPNWDLTQVIGTHLNISHLGLAIRNAQGLFYREASSDKKKVVDVPLVEYLQNYLKSPTVKGINVQQIVRPVTM